MSIFVDQKYLVMVGGRFRNFKRKGAGLYNFSCVKCGDSQKKKKSAHCYAFPADDGLRVYCHRCGFSSWFGKFLKSVDDELYGEYLLEAFGRDDRRTSIEDELDRAAELASQAPPEFTRRSDPTDELPSVSELPRDHIARMTCVSRMIPRDRWDDVYHVDDFVGWAKKIVPGKYDSMTFTEPRLLLPIRDRTSRLIGFQGRSYSSASRAKYMTAALDREPPFLFGQERVQEGSPIVVMEGPIDSMFVPNAVASAGGVVQRELAKTGLSKSSFVVAYDNEPRSPITVDKVRRAAREGYPVFVWPEDVRAKDFNDWHVDLVESGVKPESIPGLMAWHIARRTFTDLEAELEIQHWSKT